MEAGLELRVVDARVARADDQRAAPAHRKGQGLGDARRLAADGLRRKADRRRGDAELADAVRKAAGGQRLAHAVGHAGAHKAEPIVDVQRRGAEVVRLQDDVVVARVHQAAHRGVAGGLAQALAAEARVRGDHVDVAAPLLKDGGRRRAGAALRVLGKEHALGRDARLAEQLLPNVVQGPALRAQLAPGAAAQERLLVPGRKGADGHARGRVVRGQIPAKAGHEKVRHVSPLPLFPPCAGLCRKLGSV